MAMSINGFIAREDRREDFLSQVGWVELARLSKKAGALIWGRKTYEAVKKWDKGYLEDLKSVRKIILSSNPDFQLDGGFFLASGPKDALQKLEKEGFSETILTGGASNNSSFAKEDLIDEVILNMDPVLVGKGILLFAPSDLEYRLRLLGVKKLSGQTIQLHYKVIK